MFCLCLKKTINTKEVIRIILFGWPRNTVAIGALTAQIKDASEDILLARATNNQTKQHVIPTKKDKAIVTPKKVATPLPPLNFNHIGKQCPTIAPKAET